MSTFICSKCGTVDNTACGGTFWKSVANKDNEILCEKCNTGEWHNIFPLEHWSTYGTQEKIIEFMERQEGDFVNAADYFKDVRDGVGVDGEQAEGASTDQ